jgi:hypothetical protein
MPQAENPEQASDAKGYDRIRRDAAGRASARDAESRNGMKRHSSLKRVMLLGAILSVGGVLYAQRTPDKKLILNGKATSAAVLQMDGHSYLDVEALAQITKWIGENRAESDRADDS